MAATSSQVTEIYAVQSMVTSRRMRFITRRNPTGSGRDGIPCIGMPSISRGSLIGQPFTGFLFDVFPLEPLAADDGNSGAARVK